MSLTTLSSGAPDAMSFYTDFIVAAEAEVPEVAAEEVPAERWEGFSVKGITELELANLWSLLSAEADPAALHARFGHEDCGEEAERTLSRVPRPLLELLSAVPDAALPGLAARWAETEGFRGMTDHSHLAGLLRDLRALARRAIGGRLVMLVCVSGF